MSATVQFEMPDHYLVDELYTDEHKIIRDATRDWVNRSVKPPYRMLTCRREPLCRRRHSRFRRRAGEAARRVERPARAESRPKRSGSSSMSPGSPIAVRWSPSSSTSSPWAMMPGPTRRMSATSDSSGSPSRRPDSQSTPRSVGRAPHGR